jgi:glycosyltransferase involved in cell wall biosynthesis
LLQSGYVVDVLSLAPEDSSQGSVRYFTLPKQRRVFSKNWWIRFVSTRFLSPGHPLGEGGEQYREAIFGEIREVFETEYDLCIIENIDLLPGLLQFPKIARVILDLREYHPGESEASMRWQLLRKPEVLRYYNKHVPKVDGVFTVSKRIQTKLKNLWNIDSKVLLSVSDQKPSMSLRRSSLPIRFVYHGLADPFRDLEYVVRSFGDLPNVTLTLVLVGHNREIKKLESLASQFKNVFIRNPVESSSIVSMLQEFDGGVAFFPLNNFNLIASMPNKFFEYISAGLVPLVAKTTAMADFVSTSGFGLIADREGPDCLRCVLSKLDSVEFAKQSQHLGKARADVSLDLQREVFIGEVERILKL